MTKKILGYQACVIYQMTDDTVLITKQRTTQSTLFNMVLRKMFLKVLKINKEGRQYKSKSVSSKKNRTNIVQKMLPVLFVKQFTIPAVLKE